MAKHELTTKLSRSVHKVGLKINKNMPEILMVAGTAGVITSTVMACKATLKVNEVVEDAKNDIEKIHVATENGYTESGVEYSAEDGKKDLTIAYVQTGVKLAKLYGPAVVVGVASIGCFVKSNDILNNRYLGMAAAYTAVDKGYKEYRERVVERFGEELDKELRYNLKAKEVNEIVIDDEGEEHEVQKIVTTADPYETSPYAKFFDEWCTGWTKNAEKNLYFLRQQENAANFRLKQEGFLFLNDVYAMIGVPKTKAGQMVGWVYDPLKPNKINFGIYDVHNEQKRDFVNGYERSILLDFNVDGNILDLI